MAMAGARFTNSLLEALEGKKGVVEPTFVLSPVAAADGATWFSTNVELGVNGVEKIHPLGPLSDFEKKLYDAAVPELVNNIKKGEQHVKNKSWFREILKLLALIVITTLGVTIFSDLIKLNRPQPIDLESDPILAIANNRGENLDPSELPILLLPKEELLVIWDILCLQLFQIPAPWLRTFGCTILPTEPKTEHVFLSSASKTFDEDDNTFWPTPEADADSIRTIPLTTTSKTFQDSPSPPQVKTTGSVQTLIHSMVQTSTLINIEPSSFIAFTKSSEEKSPVRFDTPTSIPAPTSVVEHESGCIFCGIAENPRELSRKVFEDDKYVAFHDINPSSRVHLLLVPKNHIGSIQDLTYSDVPMLEEMKAIAHSILSETFKIPTNDHHLGFHVPPFTSVPHLHLHVIGTPFKNWVRSAKYPEARSWWFNGDALAVRLFGKGRWIRWWIEVDELIDCLEEAKGRGDARPFSWDFFKN
ncbi:Malate dehydrogenase, cytoplasmic [Podochytrium sp. JEL0797]|nr:Malate dehydrogenase, cytoplasmic [Podochytrium sp. JEL0797]